MRATRKEAREAVYEERKTVRPHESTDALLSEARFRGVARAAHKAKGLRPQSKGFERPEMCCLSERCLGA